MTEEERRVSSLSEADLRREIDTCDVDDPKLELLLGEAERRNIDL